MTISLNIIEYRDMHKVPRQWLGNIAYTIIGKPFADWVSTEVANRNDALARKNNLIIDMDPQIAAAFHTSVNISSKYNHYIATSTYQQLIVILLHSYQWNQFAPPQSWLQA